MPYYFHRRVEPLINFKSYFREDIVHHLNARWKQHIIEDMNSKFAHCLAILLDTGCMLIGSSPTYIAMPLTFSLDHLVYFKLDWYFIIIDSIINNLDLTSLNFISLTSFATVTKELNYSYTADALVIPYSLDSNLNPDQHKLINAIVFPIFKHFAIIIIITIGFIWFSSAFGLH